MDAATMVAKRQSRGMHLVGSIGQSGDDAIPVLGPLTDVAELVRREHITHVIVSSRGALAAKHVLPQLLRTPVTIMVNRTPSTLALRALAWRSSAECHC